MIQRNKYKHTLTIEIESGSLATNKKDIREQVQLKVQAVLDELVDSPCSGIERITYSISENFVNVVSHEREASTNIGN